MKKSLSNQKTPYLWCIIIKRRGALPDTSKAKNNMATQYTLEQIEKQKRVIAEAQYELAYYEALEFLENLNQHAEVELVDYLADYYKVSTKLVFEFNDILSYFSKSNALENVKRGIRFYKMNSGGTKSPTWANEAKKRAAIIDEYRNKKAN